MDTVIFLASLTLTVHILYRIFYAAVSSPPHSQTQIFADCRYQTSKLFRRSNSNKFYLKKRSLTDDNKFLIIIDTLPSLKKWQSIKISSVELSNVLHSDSVNLQTVSLFCNVESKFSFSLVFMGLFQFLLKIHKQFCIFSYLFFLFVLSLFFKSDYDRRRRMWQRQRRRPNRQQRCRHTKIMTEND